MNETANAAIKQKIEVFVRSRAWRKQFRELVIKCVAHNIARALAASENDSESP